MYIYIVPAGLCCDMLSYKQFTGPVLLWKARWNHSPNIAAELVHKMSTYRFRIPHCLSFYVFLNLCRPSEASTWWYCAIPRGNPRIGRVCRGAGRSRTRTRDCCFEPATAASDLLLRTCCFEPGTAASNPGLLLRTRDCHFEPGTAASNPGLLLRTRDCCFEPGTAASNPELLLRTRNCCFEPGTAASNPGLLPQTPGLLLRTRDCWFEPGTAASNPGLLLWTRDCCFEPGTAASNPGLLLRTWDCSSLSSKFPTSKKANILSEDSKNSFFNDILSLIWTYKNIQIQYEHYGCWHTLPIVWLNYRADGKVISLALELAAEILFCVF
jgi:hypothetical protein